MSQGEFTKEEADSCIEAIKELAKAIPKSKLADYFGHLNDLFLFMDAAKAAAPHEKK